MNHKNIKIAIATPGRYKPMGTFSKNYVDYLPFKKIFLFGGFVPYFYEGTTLKKQKYIRILYTLLGLNNNSKINTLIKNRFKKILIKEEVDCVLSEFLNTGAAIRAACEELNIPIVSNVLGYEIHKNDVLDKNKESYSLLANYNSVVIPVAKNMIPKLQQLGFNDSQIRYSPLGAREEFFDITPNYHAQTFVAVGRFTESKSPESTIKAFNKVLKIHPNAKLIMAGDGELLEVCKKLALDLNCSNAIDFVGWISQEQQIMLYKKSSIFVQHSVTAKNGDAEGTPVAILEASAAGLAIISTKHGGIVDTVIDNKTGYLIPEYNWELMGDKMIKLLNNPENTIIFGKNGKHFIKENFSMMKHIETVTCAINDIVNKK